ncbi:hypothetical protein TYRP_023455 [Tyrophagus putrescentiae]|nr:hypothetical protein TYRP_023455 [Tyrophagus putrescentiae]
MYLDQVDGQISAQGNHRGPRIWDRFQGFRVRNHRGAGLAVAVPGAFKELEGVAEEDNDRILWRNDHRGRKVGAGIVWYANRGRKWRRSRRRFPPVLDDDHYHLNQLSNTGPPPEPDAGHHFEDALAGQQDIQFGNQLQENYLQLADHRNHRRTVHPHHQRLNEDANFHYHRNENLLQGTVAGRGVAGVVWIGVERVSTASAPAGIIRKHVIYERAQSRYKISNLAC